MSKYHVRWTDEEAHLARRLLRENTHPDEFHTLLGKSKKAAQAHLRHRDNPRDKRLEEKNAIRRRYGALVVPDEVLMEATVRNSAPITLTAYLLGDPRPGQSALDKREERA
jgi:hypothetical protein